MQSLLVTEWETSPMQHTGTALDQSKTHPVSPLVPLWQQVEEELDQLQAIAGYG